MAGIAVAVACNAVADGGQPAKCKIEEFLMEAFFVKEFPSES